MTPTDTASSLNKKEEDCFKALRCLYIAVPEAVVDDVNTKVKTYIKELKKEKK